MDYTQGIKIVGTNLGDDGVTGSITAEVPLSQMGLIQEKLGISTSIGSWSEREMGERYGLRSGTQALSMPVDRKAEIELARDLYKSEPIIANVVDLLVDFSATGMENRCSDKKAKQYFDNVCKYGDVDSLHRHIFKEYFIGSDVFTLRGSRQVVTFGPDKGSDFFRWTVLNPKYVRVEGTLMFGSERIGIEPNKELVDMVKDKPKYNRKLSGLPKELREAALSGGVYFPNESKISRISRKRQPYERYATPFLARVFEPVLIKRRMREADLALAETVKSVLITFTIGDKDLPATQDQLVALSNIISTPAKSMELVWNHTLKVDYHYPDSGLFDTSKYDQVNSDIEQGLGVPMVLIDGGGGTFATAFTGLLSVIERLEAARSEVIRWQEREYLRIAEEMGLDFKAIPSVYFAPLNLRDEKVFGAFLLEMYDRGLISIETFMTLTDMDIEVEMRNRNAENSAKLAQIFKPRQAPKSKIGGGRPTTDKLDPGNYTTRDQIPQPKSGKPDKKPRVNPSNK